MQYFSPLSIFRHNHIVSPTDKILLFVENFPSWSQCLVYFISICSLPGNKQTLIYNEDQQYFFFGHLIEEKVGKNISRRENNCKVPSQNNYFYLIVNKILKVTQLHDNTQSSPLFFSLLVPIPMKCNQLNIFCGEHKYSLIREKS